MTNSPPLLVWTPEMVRRFWDYMSDASGDYFTHLYGAEIVRQLGPHLKDRGPIFDYGCGPGFLINEILQANMWAAGMDLSPETVCKVNEVYGGRPGFIRAFTKETLLKTDMRFGTIILTEVIEHLYDADLNALLQELRDRLTPWGHVIFTTPNEEDLEKSYILCPHTGEVFHRMQHVRNWSKESLSDYLEEQGYEIIDCFATSFRGGLSKAKGKGAVARQLAILKASIKARRSKKKPPHLVAIARPVAALT